MSENPATIAAPNMRTVVIDTLRDETGVWLFVFKTLLAYDLTGWLAMRFSLPQPSTAMLTVIIVANRQTGMVLAKSFYRAVGTLAGAAAAFLIVALFPQQRELFLLALSLWIGLCAGGATLYRNFKSYAFVLGGYTAAIISLPVINHPEYNLLMMIYGTESGTMLPSELAEAAGEKSANITRLTNELCDKELIARASSTDDRRKVELSLTPAGLALINSFLPDICDLLERQGRDLSAIEQRQLEKLLKKMLNGLAS